MSLNFKFNLAQNFRVSILSGLMLKVFYQIRKTLGVQSSNIHNFDIDAQEYRNTKYTLATDFEKVVESGFSGMNTRAGDILNVRFDHKDTNPLYYAHQVQVVLHSDNIMEITGSGITIMDLTCMKV